MRWIVAAVRFDGRAGWQAPVEAVAADDGDVVVATGDLQRQPYGPITFAVLDAKTGAEEIAIRRG